MLSVQSQQNNSKCFSDDVLLTMKFAHWEKYLISTRKEETFPFPMVFGIGIADISFLNGMIEMLSAYSSTNSSFRPTSPKLPPSSS